RSSAEPTPLRATTSQNTWRSRPGSKWPHPDATGTTPAGYGRVTVRVQLGPGASAAPYCRCPRAALSRRRRLVADDTINHPPSHLAEDGKAGHPEAGRDPGAPDAPRTGELREGTVGEDRPAPGAAGDPWVAAVAEGAQTAVPGSPVVAAPKRRRGGARTQVIGTAGGPWLP